MADLFPFGATPANGEREGDDLLSILNREAQNAIHRIAEQLSLPREPPRGVEGNAEYRLVDQVYQARRERNHFFDQELLSDPVWDILLMMFREHLAGRPVTPNDAVTAAQVPPNTARRWIAAMEQRDLVTQRSGGDYLELTAGALTRLQAYMDRLRKRRLMRII
jgi:hypothetical protein